MKLDPEALKAAMAAKLQSLNPRIIKGLIAVAATVALAGLGLLGHKLYSYYVGPQKALEQLAAAVKAADAEALAKYVNFSSLGDDFGQAAANVYGTRYVAGKVVNYSEEAQKAFLRAIQEAKSGEKKDDKNKSARPSFELPPPPPVLPHDFIAQLSIFKVVDAHDGVLLLSSSIHHEGLNTIFNILARMEKTPFGWQVTRLANAAALVQKYRDAMQYFFDRQDAVVLKKNEQVARRMENSFQIQSCQAAAGLVGDGTRAMMAINITAFNISDKTIHNTNMLLDIKDHNDDTLRQVRLNSQDKVYPGDVFKGRWVMELDPKAEEYAPLLKAARLSCKPTLKAMTLGSEVIWITELKNHDNEY